MHTHTHTPHAHCVSHSDTSEIKPQGEETNLHIYPRCWGGGVWGGGQKDRLSNSFEGVSFSMTHTLLNLYIKAKDHVKKIKPSSQSETTE